MGRSAAAKALDDEAVLLAVQAHVRHRETRYDALLAGGMDRRDARDRVRSDVERIVSIETQATDVDLWTPVATAVGVPVATETIEV